ncbi:CBO0543 family protein [Alkalihalophilus lindianensis]|uniref:CBO0543 family protein n=1 Tax=Alkalihalophilus lindianensis TaxID=1630542 RepID=A0ABU3X5C4_9BACI|nr:CBO0543 family protein [Alkalihalophilus lindianensis]MDV2682832.1 CBO0543 family protein [Alkalihalophilus lindianensis]
MEKVMDQDQLKLYEKIESLKEQVSQIEMEYWTLYSGFDTFEFWVLLLLWFIAPLIILYFFIDRRNMFLLGFYGFNIHVWFGYLDTAGDRIGLWGYPYELVPFLSGNISLEATLVPVAFMLVYQWTLNHHKNFYLYSFMLSLILAFLFKPIISAHHFFELYKGITYFHLLLSYCLIFLFSKFITNVFLKMQRK